MSGVEPMKKESDDTAPIVVLSEHMNEPCHKRFDDIAIASAPEAIFTDDGAIVVQALQLVLRRILQECGDRLKEHWHHAEFFVTDDPEIVSETVDEHCAACIAGNDQAFTFLRENPGKKLIVGRIWWVLRRPH